MAVIRCPVCKKRMVTQKILDSHTKLRHSEAPVEAPVIEPKELSEEQKAEAPKEETEPVEQPTPAEAAVESPANQAQPDVQPVSSKGETLDQDSVVLKSADNRELELSINDLNFKGKEIKVPKEMAITARRSLLEGGFFLKD